MDPLKEIPVVLVFIDRSHPLHAFRSRSDPPGKELPLTKSPRTFLAVVLAASSNALPASPALSPEHVV